MAELYRPPALPCEPTRNEFEVLPWVVIVSCEFSTEKPNQTLLLIVLGHAEAVLPRPAEAHGVLRIDRHGQRFGAIVFADLGFRHQAPHLAAGEGPAALQRGLTPNLALAQDVAVALVVVGGDAGAEEVGFHSNRSGSCFSSLPCTSIEIRD